MANARGKQNRDEPGAEAPRPDEERRDATDEQSIVSELARRALALGLSGVFFTESTIRKALGDTLPREWSDFAIDQSERTRQEFLDRMTFEIGQALERIDVAAVFSELMRGRTLDISASIRLTEDESEEGPEHSFRVRLRGDEPEE